MSQNTLTTPAPTTTSWPWSVLAVGTYLACIVTTNVLFSTIGPAMLTFVVAGLTLAARDWVHELQGWRVAACAVLVGAALSAVLAAPAVAMASLAAFLLAELLDLAVYSRVRRHHSRALAVLTSGVAGSLLDSVVFLSIALGSLDLFWLQATGKVGATFGAAALVLVVTTLRRR